MTTNARSGTRASPFPDRRHDETSYHQEQRDEPDSLAARERARVIAQLEPTRAGSHGDRQERVVTAQDLPWVAIDADAPVEVPVFRDEHVARIAWRWLERDGHLPRIPRGDPSVRGGRGRQAAQRRRIDRSCSRKQDNPVISG